MTDEKPVCILAISSVGLSQGALLVPEDQRDLAAGKQHHLFLSGPVGVGLNELKRKLLISDTQHYGVTVPRK